MSASKFAASALIALASVAATSAAFAGNDNNYPQINTRSTLSRAEVQAQLAQVRKDGTLQIGNDDSYPVLPQVASNKTRADVIAEYVAARKAGLIPVEHS
ncbi:MAG: DUF4148 domain-containing protein [Burkholderiales bacterium]|nr:DUF4148 domain-containing protein [Burkholderiales bacterium]